MEKEFYPFLRYISKTRYYVNKVVVGRDCRIIYIISGSGYFEYDNKRIRLLPHTLVYYSYDQPYIIKSDELDKLEFYTLNFDFSHEYTDIEVMTPKAPGDTAKESILKTIPDDLVNIFTGVIGIPDAFMYEKEFENIFVEYVNKGVASRSLCDSLLRILLIKIIRSQTSKAEHNPICERVKGMIYRDIKTDIKKIAKKMNYHPFYLNEIFKKTNGISLHKYIIKQRLIKANDLICTTDMSLLDISLICGFCSQSHMTDVFKKTYGITPKKLRGIV